MKAVLGRKYKALFGEKGYITKGKLYTCVKNNFYLADGKETSFLTFTNDSGLDDGIAINTETWEEVKLTPLNEIIYEIEQDVTAV